MLKRMKIEDVSIGDILFKIRPLGAMNATYVFGDLVSVVLPIIGTTALSSGIEKTDALTPEVIEKIVDNLDTDSIASSLAKVDGKTITKLISELVIDYRNVSIKDGNEWRIMTLEDFDEIFCMYLAGEIKLCAAVVKQNFGSFFGDVGALYGSLLEKAAQKRTSLNMGNLTTNK